MTTTIGKVLAVVTAVASLVFFGFVSVGVFGGTNWRQIASDIETDKEMPYSFALSEGENPQWTASKHVGEGSIPANKALDPVVVAVMQDLTQQEQTELNELTPEVSQLDEQIAAADVAIEADRAAVEAKAKELLDDLKQLRDQVQAATEQAQLQGEEVQKIKDRIEARREDVFRLSAQLEEIRGDRFRIQQIQQQLTDLIQQLDGSIERAQRRRDQLDNHKP
jgi:hypothetical protein